MITVTAAKELIRTNCQALSPVTMPLLQAAGKTLAHDIWAPNDIPAFPQSSMDGYAISYKSWKTYGLLDLFGEIAAGRGDSIELPDGKAFRIFTGAPVPFGADTVVMQEKCRVVEDELSIDDPSLKAGDNVRPVGSEISKGALALEKGTLLTPAAIGFLAGIGITEVSIYPSPSISIIVTGNELQTPGNPLSYGQVYESNSLTLSAALQQLSLHLKETYRVEDQLETLTKTLGHAIEQSDIVLITGGISVGDYDFTLKAAMQCGAETVFHKIKQKPGKPILFAKKGTKLVFGLPGNPASVLTCFYEYVLLAISMLQNRSVTLAKKTAPLEKEIKKPAGITHYLKGHFNGTTVLPLDGQESYKLNSFAKANCLIMLPEEVTQCQTGEAAEIHLLPQ
ncbi:molybdopterin molybdotransferase MoeA [Flavihumibacter profundi]|jgi:molybdopterin molybdotransferase|uniref:molybdopterin molybdotransferase MoeA n=1 Tax=Flavihumibacter profundi TaxID=2716883 RepID=UPI001CC79043|nr:gephyrin-like molybdotransferase Glp [Flavihumibacter profundi]MBZ5858327.1 molybdopterin molybdotransferase MoeA [Flavihumibacter profundi]